MEVLRLFEDQARRSHDRPAIISRGVSFSYGSLRTLSNQLADYLFQRGVTAETRVALCLERGSLLVSAILAVLKPGAAYVPLDPTHPRERLSYILNDVEPAFLITDRPFYASIVPAIQSCIFFDSVENALSGCSIDAPAVHAYPEGLAYITYTSGSTGRPKGVCVTRGAVDHVFLSLSRVLNLKPEDRWLAVTTVAFDIALVELILPLCAGGCVIIAASTQVADPYSLLELISDLSITAMQATPSGWLHLLSAGAISESLKLALCGGDIMSPTLAKRLQTDTRAVLNLYGPTETTIWSTLSMVCDSEMSASISIGQPLGDTIVRVLDEDLGLALHGEIGQLYIGGPGVARGYWKQRALTAERFLPDPFSVTHSARLYRTGDLARFDQLGNLHFCGRIDDQVKVRGYRVELGEIESVLKEIPGVSDSVVSLSRDDRGDVLWAHIVPEKGCSVTVPDVRSFLESRLPHYMIPNNIKFLHELPLNLNGKVDRTRLAKIVSEEAPAFDEPLNTLTERSLKSIWCEVFQRSHVSRQADFFSLGGHSLLATQIIIRVWDALHVEVTLADLLDQPVLEDFAKLIDARLTMTSSENT